MTIQTTLDINLDTIYRFELFPNSSSMGDEQAFNLYGILIIPQLLGAIIFQVFGIREVYFWTAWAVLGIFLLNIYFFYKKTIHYENVLKLIINNNYLQIMDNKNIYMKAHMENVIFKKVITGKENFLAIQISSEDFKGILIGLKKQQIKLNYKETQPLSLPDYWLVNEKEWDNFNQQIFRTQYTD